MANEIKKAYESELMNLKVTAGVFQNHARYELDKVAKGKKKVHWGHVNDIKAAIEQLNVALDDLLNR